MASGDPQYDALVQLMHRYFSDDGNIPSEYIYHRINDYLNRKIGDSCTADQLCWLESFLLSFTMYYLSDWFYVSELLICLNETEAQLYSAPIAEVLYRAHSSIADSREWDTKWVDYCALVGSVIETRLDELEHEQRLIRILVQVFAEKNHPSLENILLEGAATCLSKMSKPVVLYIRSKEWDMTEYGMGGRVTLEDWCLWDARLLAFKHDKSQTPEARSVAAKALLLMRGD
ncbi:hypothetical protein F5B22DRAFT_579732 [Xylaria bambusicola]|uniref:uncharacterized protein n=1 Tax=Xylaria bambusicola TaxID=326684 RepID=UPI002008C48D|nr:uncharacterized protein F5B22DRAFT_579732 [Xylaria bambusicola]KAI0502942.1 hypothetical protein F5B22DRAFT_579732 [Xylaria bambusicola]